MAIDTAKATNMLSRRHRQITTNALILAKATNMLKNYHLPDEQPVVFDNDNFIDDVVDKSSMGVSQFLNWMGCNSSEQWDMQVAKELLYCKFPTKFVWKKKERQWSLRKKGFTIGRLVHVPPNCGEPYFMRIVLNHVKGPKCFEDIKTVDEVVCPTFREACYKLGLIGDDREYFDAIKQAADWGSGFYLRNLFSTYYSLLKNYALMDIESSLQLNGGNLTRFQAVASSGIAATLIPGGVTAHSRLSIPLNVNEDSTCSRIKPGGDLTELLIRAKLIIWDDAPMTHKHSFEAVDKSLKDVMRVVMNERNADRLEVLRLTKNMCLQVGRTSDNVDDIRKFSEWILEIGDGLVGCENDGEVDLQFPDDLLIQQVADPIASIVNVTYPDLQSRLWNPDYPQERAILAPTHKIVEAVNNYVLSKIDEVIYLSSDEVSSDDRGMGDPDLHSIEYLNSIKCSGLLNHQLKLKVGAMVMLLRNIDQSRGLCNGTRLIVTDLALRVIRCTVLTGSHKGDHVHIARLTLTPSDFSKFPVRFSRRQFPIAVCFAMTL
ncbi:uncharacterized protein LOC141651143 [Silene latifolia]|uniref:uncharacterized protein LOC141651143 n=1 Tax=Silene latifolia TaxID=37657 RepID=UPI003D76F931